MLELFGSVARPVWVGVISEIARGVGAMCAGLASPSVMPGR